MHPLRLPWLELCVLIPLLAAIRVGGLKVPDSARRLGLLASGLALACAIAAWQGFAILGTPGAGDGLAPPAGLLRGDLLALDELSAPLLPMAALVAYTSWDFFVSSWQQNEQSSNYGGLPQWPVKFLIPLAFALLFVQGISELIKRIAIINGDLPDDRLDGGHPATARDAGHLELPPDTPAGPKR